MGLHWHALPLESRIALHIFIAVEGQMPACRCRAACALLVCRLMRHGRSKANEAKLIVSRLENGIKPEYGLSPTGIEQATAAG